MKTKISIIVMIAIATIITSYSVMGTYARYTTKVEDTSSARVAKWGFNMVKTVDLFKDSYFSVNGKNIIAPGTEGSYEFTIVGKPETSYNLIVELPKEECIDTIGRIKYRFDEEPWVDNIQGLLPYIREVYDRDTTYEPNTDASLDWFGDSNTHKISWKWIFDDGTGNNGTNLDIIDTNIGKVAVVNPNGTENANPPQVKFTIRVTAEQAE